MEVVTREITSYSNSGKTKTIRLYVRPEKDATLDTSYLYSSTDELGNYNQYARQSFEKFRKPTKDELNFFNKNYAEHIERQNKENDAKAKKEQERNDFYSSETLNVKVSTFIDDIIEELQSNGDHTIYHPTELALVIINKIEGIEIERRSENQYNSHYFLKNADLLKKVGENIFYIQQDNKLLYKIECEDEIFSHYFYETTWEDFINIKITKLK